MVARAARRAPLVRDYSDIDYVVTSKAASRVPGLFVELGYAPDEEFNSLHGGRRLFFTDPEHDHEADVFIDVIRGCHTLELADRLELAERTITPTDLLLSKLQVVETNRKDFTDVIALLADHSIEDEDRDGVISLDRIRSVCSTDWGWWRTVTQVAAQTLEVADRLASAEEITAEAPARLRALIADLEASPKSRRWKLRAKVGERVRWHEEPEGVQHDHA